MALFKCKMCGGDLEIAQGTFVAECEYCGTKQTVPKCADENLQNVFNRANSLRLKNEFDKAEKLYETIIQADSTQAEAYWGLLLCRYGIEYVDDPKTLKKIPTCHRASYESIVEDGDYKLALTHADISQRSLYAAQAVEIDRIQKGILALAKKEEAYDVFICYKETDENGQRTVDSVIANDIYHQLTQVGYKVFYSAITLEGKLGNAYEPIIFAALNSAKVMLVIGTKPSHFNAVWVKNEWSRFLRLAKGDRSRLIIPCYRNMDAYELPDEFAHIQAQDMSKIGFINDIVRGIGKVVGKYQPQYQPQPQQNATPAAAAVPVNEEERSSASAHLKRAFMFLEDGAWSTANTHCEQVLNINPECAEAYVVKLMIERKVKTLPELVSCKTPLTESGNYVRALRFATPEYKGLLESYNAAILQRRTDEMKESIYKNGIIAMARNEYAIALKSFERIPTYKDVDSRARFCKNQIQQKIEQNTLINTVNQKKTRFSRKAALIMLLSFLLLVAVCFVASSIGIFASECLMGEDTDFFTSIALCLVSFCTLILPPTSVPFFLSLFSMFLRYPSTKAKTILNMASALFAVGNIFMASFIMLMMFCDGVAYDNVFAAFFSTSVPFSGLLLNIMLLAFVITVAIMAASVGKAAQQSGIDAPSEA